MLALMNAIDFSQRLFATAALILLTSAGASPAAAAPAGDRDTANRLVTEFIQAQNTMNVALFDDIFTPGYIQHNPDVAPGLAGVKKVFADEFAQIRKARITIHAAAESVVVDGDVVVLRQVTRIEKAGKVYEERSLDEWRIVDGHFGEHWDSDSTPRRVN